MALRPGEHPSAFLQRVFHEVFAMSDHSLDRINEIFHARFVMNVDGRKRTRRGLEQDIKMQRVRLFEPPKFKWKQLVVTEPIDGVYRIMSVHNVDLHLRDGSRCCQKVVALIQVDAKEGKIVQADELTRSERPSTLEEQNARALEAGIVFTASPTEPPRRAPTPAPTAPTAKRPCPPASMQFPSYDSTMTDFSFEAERASADIPSASPSPPQLVDEEPAAPAPSYRVSARLQPGRFEGF